jgi:hypothetical protein
VNAGHDDSKLDLESKLEERDEDSPSALAGGEVASIEQSLADMRSNELSGRNLSFRKQKNRKKTASGGTVVAE